MPETVICKGFLSKFSGSFYGGPKFSRYYAELLDDGTFRCYDSTRKLHLKHTVNIRDVVAFLALGTKCQSVPSCPSEVPENAYHRMIGIPLENKKSTQVIFFLCQDDDDFKRWETFLYSVLPFRSRPNVSVDKSATLPVGISQNHSSHYPISTLYPTITVYSNVQGPPQYISRSNTLPSYIPQSSYGYNNTMTPNNFIYPSNPSSPSYSSEQWTSNPTAMARPIGFVLDDDVSEPNRSTYPQGMYSPGPSKYV